MRSKCVQHVVDEKLVGLVRSTESVQERRTEVIADERAILIQSAYDAYGKLQYMLKGIEERYAKQFGLKASCQGELEGKRVGSTQNIGKSSRKRRVISADSGGDLGATWY